MKYYLLLLLLAFDLLSCEKEEIGNVNTLSGSLAGSGFFLLNEGNYMSGNGSLSFLPGDGSILHNDIFQAINGRPLGDVANHCLVKGDTCFIVVNNSGKVEVIESSTGRSLKTITGLVSPRQITKVSNHKAYVSSLYSDQISIIDLESCELKGKISMRRTSEAILLSSGKVFVSNWASGKEIIVINPDTDQVIDSLVTGAEPESMVVDGDGKIWVLCTGGYSGKYNPELVVFNPADLNIIKRIVFSPGNNAPSSLVINNKRDSIYYIAGHVWSMNTGSTELPSNPLIRSEGRTFYRLCISPSNGNIMVTDARDYQLPGYLLVFSPGGNLKKSYKAGIIPGYICFKEKGN
ncbi:MAG: hypothetical protein U0X39_01950 [Bacteroidales bacterium]